MGRLSSRKKKFGYRICRSRLDPPIGLGKRYPFFQLSKISRNVRHKSGLNRSILKTGWYKLEQALACKTTIHKVAPHYTSQRCNRCGTTGRKNRKTQSEFRCVSCGHLDNADINAARNILALGIGESLNGRGEGRSLSVKRQKELDRTLHFAMLK